jgi:hypothetical protein
VRRGEEKIENKRKEAYSCTSVVCCRCVKKKKKKKKKKSNSVDNAISTARFQLNSTIAPLKQPIHCVVSVLVVVSTTSSGLLPLHSNVTAHSKNANGAICNQKNAKFNANTIKYKYI